MGLETAAIIGIAAAGAAAVGGVANAIAVSNANSTNRTLTRETNAQNYKIFQEQMAYQTGEREATQVYNSPVEQRKRYQAAGINPYFALGNIEGGNSTAQSSPSATPMQAPQVQALPIGDILSSLSNGADKYLQMDAMQMDNESKRVDLQFKVSEKIADLAYKRQQVYNSKLDAKEKETQIRLIDEQIGIAQEDLKFLRGTASERKRAVSLQNRNMELDNRARGLKNEASEIHNSILKDTEEAQKQRIIAEWKNVLSSTNANNSQAAKNLADRLLSIAQKNGVNIDNYQKNKVNHLIRRGIQLDNKKKELENRYPGYVGREFRGAINTIFDGFVSGSKGEPFNTGSYWNN